MCRSGKEHDPAPGIMLNVVPSGRGAPPVGAGGGVVTGVGVGDATGVGVGEGAGIGVCITGLGP